MMLGIRRNEKTTIRTNRPYKLVVTTSNGSVFTVVMPIGVEFTAFITENDNVNIDFEIIEDSTIHPVS